MSSRHERRRFRRDASSVLPTYLREPNDPALAGILKASAWSWCDALEQRVRHCIVCSAWIVNKQHVGALLLTTPDIAKPTSAGIAAICRACWDADLPTEALERACASVLQAVILNGRFEQHRGAVDRLQICGPSLRSDRERQLTRERGGPFNLDWLNGRLSVVSARPLPVPARAAPAALPATWRGQ